MLGHCKVSGIWRIWIPEGKFLLEVYANAEKPPLVWGNCRDYDLSKWVAVLSTLPIERDLHLQRWLGDEEKKRRKSRSIDALIFDECTLETRLFLVHPVLIHMGGF